jgi:uncharacterized protein (DUF433 family)
METVTMETTTSAQHIASDPAICHGEPTFRGTCIIVADVLEQVESGMAYEAIIEEWRYEIDRDAIAEAVRNRTRCTRRLCARIGSVEWWHHGEQNPERHQTDSRRGERES